MDELDRILGKDEGLVPSSGLTRRIMEAVEQDQKAEPPIPFPWLRLLPALLGALGLVGIVFGLIAGLIVLGNRQVSAGRDSSEALAIARDVIEEIGGWSLRHTYERLGCDFEVATCEVTATPWQAQVEAVLSNGGAMIRVDALDASKLEVARTLRVTVSVRWVDGTRARTVRLVTVRT